jgi:hypothetical protein
MAAEDLQSARVDRNRGLAWSLASSHQAQPATADYSLRLPSSVPSVSNILDSWSIPAPTNPRSDGARATSCGPLHASGTRCARTVAPSSDNFTRPRPTTGPSERPSVISILGPSEFVTTLKVQTGGPDSPFDFGLLAARYLLHVLTPRSTRNSGPRVSGAAADRLRQL